MYINPMYRIKHTLGFDIKIPGCLLVNGRALKTSSHTRKRTDAHTNHILSCFSLHTSCKTTHSDNSGIAGSEPKRNLATQIFGAALVAPAG